MKSKTFITEMNYKCGECGERFSVRKDSREYKGCSKGCSAVDAGDGYYMRYSGEPVFISESKTEKKVC